MIYCFDTYYKENYANTAVVGIKKWNDENPSFKMLEITHNINDYESGAFYKKELPCILSIIKNIDLNPQEDVLIVDGYVFLSDDKKLGLGGYLYNKLDREIPVIGVAKNNFFNICNFKKEVYRGCSKKPLYITTVGIELEHAAKCIQSMSGAYRIPTILKYVDRLGREQQN